MAVPASLGMKYLARLPLWHKSSNTCNALSSVRLQNGKELELSFLVLSVHGAITSICKEIQTGNSFLTTSQAGVSGTPRHRRKVSITFASRIASVARLT